MASSYIFGLPDVVIVTDRATGKIVTAPGFPILDTTVAAAALTVGLVTDGETFYMPSACWPCCRFRRLTPLVPNDDSISEPALHPRCNIAAGAGHG